MKALVYDIEIKLAIPDRNGERIEGVQYCEGWNDHANMGIAVLGAFDTNTNMPLVFCEDNLPEFASSIPGYDWMVSFNGVAFDNKLLRANGITFPDIQNYDILRELWIADGLDPDRFSPRTHGGYGLDACTQVNFGIGKSGNGAMAPVDWQRGKIGNVISYCLRDVMLTRRLFMKIIGEGGIINPKTRQFTKLRNPNAEPTQKSLIELAPANAYEAGE